MGEIVKLFVAMRLIESGTARTAINALLIIDQYFVGNVDHEGDSVPVVASRISEWCVSIPCPLR